jgi:hypothetical protein
MEKPQYWIVHKNENEEAILFIFGWTTFFTAFSEGIYHLCNNKLF